MAALTQLTALGASCIALPATVLVFYGTSPPRVDIQDHPGVLGLLSCLTGAAYDDSLPCQFFPALVSATVCTGGHQFQLDLVLYEMYGVCGHLHLLCASVAQFLSKCARTMIRSFPEATYIVTLSASLAIIRSGLDRT